VSYAFTQLLAPVSKWRHNIDTPGVSQHSGENTKRVDKLSSTAKWLASVPLSLFTSRLSCTVSHLVSAHSHYIRFPDSQVALFGGFARRLWGRRRLSLSVPTFSVDSNPGFAGWRLSLLFQLGISMNRLRIWDGTNVVLFPRYTVLIHGFILLLSCLFPVSIVTLWDSQMRTVCTEVIHPQISWIGWTKCHQNVTLYATLLDLHALAFLEIVL
jgi:hypothetical protein